MGHIELHEYERHVFGSLLLVDIKGPEGTVYENGTYIVEIFMGSTYPTKYPSVHFATRIVNPHVDPLGRITFPSPLPNPETPSLKSLIIHLLDTVMKAEIPEEIKQSAIDANWRYGEGNSSDDELDPGDPIRNWEPGRVAEILSINATDLKDHAEFFKRLEFQSEENKSSIKGFKLISKDSDVATGGTSQATGGKATEKSSSSILGKWSKGATVDEEEVSKGQL